MIDYCKTEQTGDHGKLKELDYKHKRVSRFGQGHIDFIAKWFETMIFKE